MGRVADLIAGVKEDSNLDVSEPQVLRWLQGRYDQLCERAEFYRKTFDLGAVQPETQEYAVPAGVVEILEVRVGDLVYGDARHGDFARGERAWLWLTGEGGIAGREDTEAGVQMLRLFPVPAAASEPNAPHLFLYAIADPPTLSTTDDSTLVTPRAYDDALVSGAVATGLLRDESLAGMAAPHEQIFSTACGELLRATRRRFRGDGPVMARVVGYNA